MTNAAEEARATEYRRQVEARAQWARAVNLGLRGNAAAAAAVTANWQPVLDWLREREDRGTRSFDKES